MTFIWEREKIECFGEDVEEREYSHSWRECKQGEPYGKPDDASYRMEFPFDPAMLLWLFYPTDELKSICQRDFRTFMFIVAQYPNDLSNPRAHKQEAEDENVSVHTQLNTL